jgi:phosphate starvation-inducible membrane PsiE
MIFGNQWRKRTCYKSDINSGYKVNNLLVVYFLFVFVFLVGKYSNTWGTHHPFAFSFFVVVFFLDLVSW